MKRNEYVTKYYVISGALQFLIESESPVLAAMDLFESYRDSVELDKQYFYVDERGFRTNNAAHKIEISDILNWTMES